MGHLNKGDWHEALHQCKWAWAPTQAHIHRHGQAQTLNSITTHLFEKTLPSINMPGLGFFSSPISITMGKPKAPISITTHFSTWASPSDEASTISDIEEREGVAALRAAPRRRSCCREKVSDCRCVTTCS